MAALGLLSFQQKALDSMVEAALNYFTGTPDTIGGRPVPFVGQLKAVTGAGKTPILASVIAKMSPAVVLWTTKYGSVVDQTFANLHSGGKYRHLLGSGNIEIVKFSEIPSYAAWHHILEQESGLTILVSTVAAWNSTQKDDRLNVHRAHADWGSKSRWDQLKSERTRPLWVVYDEAHNTTSEQVELLDDLDPVGFFIASASPVKGKLQYYLTLLPSDVRSQRITSVSTRDVVDAELLKSTISVADYDSEPDEMIRDVVKKRRALEKRLNAVGSTLAPKAIYVVESSNTSKGSESRPIAIWNKLVADCKVKPQSIAICTNTKNLPTAAISIKTISELSDDFTHIIFNKKLQEGWDDPSVYVCYFDGETQSATRIQQVIGRAMRQPGAHHFHDHDDDLNSAFFFINCPNDAMEGIVDDLKEELRIYKGNDEPDDFEPFQIKEERKPKPKVPVRAGIGALVVPRLQLELPSVDQLATLLKKKTIDFSQEDRSAPGRALINVVSVRTGDVTHQQRDLLEDMRIGCGRYLQDQIKGLSKNCLNALDPALFNNAKLNKTACYRSKALEYYRELAFDIVQHYENHVRLAQLSDPQEHEYSVGPYQPSGSIRKFFTHSGHAYYDSKAFNNDELDLAKALDHFTYRWVRNKDRLDYGIPLPHKSHSSSTFYPDFLWWVGKTIWALDPTGKHILDEKVRAKLLTVPDPLKIALVTKGSLDAGFKKTGDSGWSLVRLRMGNAAPENFDSLADLLDILVGESASGKAKTKKSKS